MWSPCREDEGAEGRRVQAGKLGGKFIDLKLLGTL